MCLPPSAVVAFAEQEQLAGTGTLLTVDEPDYFFLSHRERVF